jgi:hypothetical protein
MLAGRWARAREWKVGRVLGMVLSLFLAELDELLMCQVG